MVLYHVLRGSPIFGVNIHLSIPVKMQTIHLTSPVKMLILE